MARKTQQVIHWPRLDTVLMVEEAIRKARTYPGKLQLWKSLRKRMMYQTFSLILDYLEKSGKILIAKDRRIVWIGSSPKLEAAIARGTRVR